MNSLTKPTKEALMVLAAAVVVVSLGGWPVRSSHEADAHEQRLASMRREAARWIATTRQQEEAAQARKRQAQAAPRLALDNDVTTHSTALQVESARLELEPALEDSRVIAPASTDSGLLIPEPRRRAQETL